MEGEFKHFLEGDLVLTKVCTKCLTEQDKTEFYKRTKSEDGLCYVCKTCQKKQHKERYEANKEAVCARTTAHYYENKEKYSQYARVRYEENKEEIRLRHKENYENNRESILERQKKYKEANPELVREQSRNWRLRNLERAIQNSRQYYENNKEKVLERTAKYSRRRYASDPLYALIQNIRSRIFESLRTVNTRKSKGSNEYIGCTWQELAVHIERQFSQGMNWDNKGEWHVDHIIPLASAKTADDLEHLLHFTNLRPLWGKDNMEKSGKRTLLI